MSLREDSDVTPDLPVAQESTSVVAKGIFNPAIFSPRWFHSADLIGDVELEDSKVEVISGDFTQFRMGWLNFTATTDSLQLITVDVEERLRLRDAAVGMLRTLAFTPMNALGINTDSHTILPSPAALHHIGDTLAPKAVWDDFLEFPAVRSMLMWGARRDGWEGRLNVRVEPSVLYSPAVFIAFNDHYDLERQSHLPATRNEAFANADQPREASDDKRLQSIDILNENWSDMMERAVQAHARIRALALEV